MKAPQDVPRWLVVTQWRVTDFAPKPGEYAAKETAAWWVSATSCVAGEIASTAHRGMQVRPDSGYAAVLACIQSPALVGISENPVVLLGVQE